MRKPVVSATAVALTYLAFLAMSFVGGPALAAKVSQACGKDHSITVSGDKCSTVVVIEYPVDQDGNVSGPGTIKSADVTCSDGKGGEAKGSCNAGLASCGAASGDTGCTATMQPPPGDETPQTVRPTRRAAPSVAVAPPPPAHRRPNVLMPPAGLLDDGRGGFGPVGPAPTGTPSTSSPAAAPTVK